MDALDPSGTCLCAWRSCSWTWRHTTAWRARRTASTAWCSPKAPKECARAIFLERYCQGCFRVFCAKVDEGAYEKVNTQAQAETDPSYVTHYKP